MDDVVKWNDEDKENVKKLAAFQAVLNANEAGLISDTEVENIRRRYNIPFTTQND